MTITSSGLLYLTAAATASTSESAKFPSTIPSLFSTTTCDSYQNGRALVHWIYRVSGLCVYGIMEEISWLASCISVAGWILSGLYQIYLGYKTRTSAGFSGLFLLCWVMGDLSNVTGCFFTNQMTFQRILSVSSLLIDCTLLLEYFIFSEVEPSACMIVEVVEAEEEDTFGQSPDPLTSKKNGSLMKTASLSSSSSSSPTPARTLTPAAPCESTPLLSRKVVAVAAAASLIVKGANGAPLYPATGQQHHDSISSLVLSTATTSTSPPFSHSVGTVCAWISQSMYLLSVIPQIHKNYTHKSTGHVSIWLFLADLLGNFGYSLSILSAASAIKDVERRAAFLREERPFLIGTSTTFLLELIILTQYYLYSATTKMMMKTAAAATTAVYYDDACEEDENIGASHGNKTYSSITISSASK